MRKDFVFFVLFSFFFLILLSNFVEHRTSNIQKLKRKIFLHKYHAFIHTLTLDSLFISISKHISFRFDSFRLNLYFVRACKRVFARTSVCICGCSCTFCEMRVFFFFRTSLAYLIWKQINFITPQTIEHSVCAHCE